MASEAARLIKLVHLDLNPLIGLATVPAAGRITFTGPLNENFKYNVVSITMFPGTTLASDAGGVTIASNFRTGSVGATTTAIKAAQDMTVGLQVAATPVEWFRGRQAMAPGEWIEFISATDAALTTPAIGAHVIIEYEVTERSGV